jgi:hypothetical protein
MGYLSPSGYMEIVMSSSNVVEAAHRFSRKRAILWLLLGASLLFLAAINLMRMWIGESPDSDSLDLLGRRGAWIADAGLAMLVLATGGGWRISRRVRALMEDEITARNRSAALAIGFWVAMLLGVALAATDSFRPLVAGRVLMGLVSSALSASLIAFGLFELRAYRDA